MNKNSSDWNLLLTRARLATMAEGASYGLIEDGAVGIRDDKIVWVGKQTSVPTDIVAKEVIDCRGALVTPGLIDCHTHLVFAGNRANEFEMRLRGVSSEQIARTGGGILSTVAATRAVDEHGLFEESSPRVRALTSEGVTTVEIKSGYGLDLQNEMKMLRVARFLDEALPVSTVTTFLAAHAVPSEFAGRAQDYIDYVCAEVLPAAAGRGLVDAVDAYCERIAFTPKQTAQMFDAAKKHNLPVKLHAEQHSDSGGAALAASYGALSADHLEFLNAEGVAAMARAGTVAVLLPGPYHFLRETQMPPIDALRSHGVPIAVASDCNPGTSPIVSLLANVHLACTLFHLTPEEALRGVTINAARALGRAHDRGSIEVGKRADLAIWDVKSPAELAYWLGGLSPRRVIFEGQPGRIWSRV